MSGPARAGLAGYWGAEGSMAAGGLGASIDSVTCLPKVCMHR